jgi:hypothetical protein
MDEHIYPLEFIDVAAPDGEWGVCSLARSPRAGDPK